MRKSKYGAVLVLFSPTNFLFAAFCLISMFPSFQCVFLSIVNASLFKSRILQVVITLAEGQLL